MHMQGVETGGHRARAPIGSDDKLLIRPAVNIKDSYTLIEQSVIVTGSLKMYVPAPCTSLAYSCGCRG